MTRTFLVEIVVEDDEDLEGIAADLETAVSNLFDVIEVKPWSPHDEIPHDEIPDL